MTPDGKDVKCLTCGKEIPGTAFFSHKGQAYWYPSGEFIAFLAINDHGDIFTFEDFPGVGANVNVYIMTADEENVTYSPAQPCKPGEVACYDGYLHIVGDPSWSLDGREELWDKLC